MSSHSFFSSEDIFNRMVVASIRNRIRKKTKSGGLFRLALSGGATPQKIYRMLAKEKDINWSQVELYMVDERYVPLDDKYSNHRMISESLAKPLEGKLRAFHFFDTSLPMAQALKAYEKELRVNDTSFFDLIILGIGIDGHTASLFPRSKALKIEKRWVAHAATDQFDVRDRLTLTYPALESSKEIFFLIKGEEKRSVLSQLVHSKPGNSNLPAARLFHREKTQVFFCE